MANLKSYFQARRGTVLKWSFTVTAAKLGDPARREYEIEIISLDKDGIRAKPAFNDFDDSNRKTTRVLKQLSEVTVNPVNFKTPIQVLEAIAREADSKFLGRFPIKPSGEDLERENLETRLQALFIAENRAKDEGPPTLESAERLRKFWKQNSGLVLPTLFSSGTGTVRARWMEGDTKTLWINFPSEGPLGWSVQLPRVTSSGLRKMNARCPHDEDIVPLAIMLGFNITNYSA